MGTKKQTLFSFRERLTTAASNKGISRAEFARQIGYAYSTINGWVDKNGELKLQLIQRLTEIARRLDIDPGWLVFGTGPSNEEQQHLQTLRACSSDNREMALGLLKATVDQTPIDQTPQAETPRKVIPIEAKPKKMNRRDEIPVYRILKTSRKPPKGVKARPHWYGLAAGFGRELEQCEDYYYFRELPDWRGVHSATIKGDSMEDTLLDGDLVLLQEFGGRLVLPAIGAGDEKGPMLRLKAQVPDECICVVSINDDSPTLKRIQYSEFGNDWHISVVADNPSAWKARPIGRADEVVFYAKLMGRGEKD